MTAATSYESYSHFTNITYLIVCTSNKRIFPETKSLGITWCNHFSPLQQCSHEWLYNKESFWCKPWTKLVGTLLSLPFPLEWSLASGLVPYLMLLGSRLPTYTWQRLRTEIFLMWTLLPPVQGTCVLQTYLALVEKWIYMIISFGYFVSCISIFSFE